ncbi:MAG: VCBS repeat-containing protein, partial [Planctomycetota bacterium]|nr:VCBS repeat-containing protein [Planctomycetota bacterium]
MHTIHHRLLLLGALLLGAPAASAQFTHNTADVPPSSSATENVDFADVDNDGDWDAMFANGGDSGNDQNEIWINAFNGGDPVGRFTNRTTQQLPAVLDDSRDVEFVDYDQDGDVDLYVSNTSQIANQTNRWWNNMGSQAGTIGFYQDQTAAHWNGLAQPGSSIATSLLIGGGFIDFSCDCDFGDLDNDGDIDLVHSTYGGAFNGNAPTRLFLNDGAGHFTEFNPSGFQLSGINIANGNPGIWCQGTQSADTTNATGANCDVASTPLDIDVGDIDGDLDLDILHGARQELPRMFQNRLAEQGTLGFRDVTGSAFPPNYSTGGGHYEQEMGDSDGDGDLDIYGLNWSNFDDNLLKNNGNGTFQAPVILPGSGSDDNEADFFDYDVDGDLDVFVANFSGNERIYTNNGAGTYTLASGLLPSDGTTSLDADACDVDGDGDYDVFVANDGGQAEWYLQNGTSANDVTPPSFPIVEQAPNRAAGPSATVVRCQHRDNAPYYINWYDAHRLDVTVNGGPVTSYPARSTQGDTLRATIPGSLVGTICYQFVSVDKYGNTGTSVQRCYTSTGGSTGTPYCFGDGSGTACPCGNVGAAGNGCGNSLFANGANLTATGTASISGDTLVLSGSNMPNSSALYFQGTGQANAGLGTVFGDGLRCAAGSVIRLGTKTNVA